jgi:hypothetical protein
VVTGLRMDVSDCLLDIDLGAGQAHQHEDCDSSSQAGAHASGRLCRGGGTGEPSITHVPAHLHCPAAPGLSRGCEFPAWSSLMGSTCASYRIPHYALWMHFCRLCMRPLCPGSRGRQMLGPGKDMQRGWGGAGSSGMLQAAGSQACVGGYGCHSHQIRSSLYQYGSFSVATICPWGATLLIPGC